MADMAQGEHTCIRDMISGRAHMLGTAVELAVRPVQDELARRDALAVTGIPALRELQCLVQLPADLPMLTLGLPQRMRRMIRQMSPAYVEVSGGEVIRRLVPPLVIESARVKSSAWRTGLVRASVFAPYCRRELSLPRWPVERDELMLEASYLGVGLVVGGSRALDAAPFRPTRFTPASWLFAEQVLGQIRVEPNAVA